jgi:uncharacterized protein (UPF0305 family)
VEDPFQGQAELDVWILFGKRTKKWEKRKKSMEVQMEDKKGSREVDSVASLPNRVAQEARDRDRVNLISCIIETYACFTYLYVLHPMRKSGPGKVQSQTIATHLLFSKNKHGKKHHSTLRRTN